MDRERGTPKHPQKLGEHFGRASLASMIRSGRSSSAKKTALHCAMCIQAVLVRTKSHFEVAAMWEQDSPLRQQTHLSRLEQGLLRLMRTPRHFFADLCEGGRGKVFFGRFDACT